jgi:DNA modification methylase
METTHEVVVGNARDLGCVADESVELVVTSPPYPMIEMWDGLLAELNPEIEGALSAGDGDRAFELMHAELDAVWAEVERVLVPGGIVVVNVGDATRKVDGSFRLFPNHARIVEWFTDGGFHALPDVLWRKPSNRATKFMGSGMVPPNAYASLEHEYLLTFRKGERRSFEPSLERRYRSAYFWEERNTWFSDVWTGVQGTGQGLGHEELRKRSGAFPFAVPYRLINMYSVYGDTVLDPFWGTGTTSVAAMVAGRDSIGFELREEFVSVFDDRVEGVDDRSRAVVADRIEAHREFVAERRAMDDPPAYEATHYDFPVVTRQEQDIQFYEVDSVREDGDGTYVVEHEPFVPEDR